MDRIEAIYQTITDALPGAVGDFLATNPMAAVYALIVLAILVIGFVVSAFIVRWRERNRPKKLARLEEDLREKEKINDTPQLHASLLDQRMAYFSFFSIISGVLGWLTHYRPAEEIDIFGVSLADMALPLAVLFAIIALVALLLKWFWSRTFANWDQWVEQRQREIVRLQKLTLNKRTRLDAAQKQQAALEEAAQEPVEQPASDRFSTFLHSRIAMPFVLARRIRDGKPKRVWQVGEVEKVVSDSFGFIRERVASEGSGQVSKEGDQFYFNRASVCNTEFANQGGDAFFVTSSRRAPDKKDAHPAYLVCLRDKPCRGFVRQHFSNRVCMVEIVDGHENYASVLALLDSSLVQTSTRLKPGDRVEGIVTHNNLGVMLKQVKPVQDT